MYWNNQRTDKIKQGTKGITRWRKANPSKTEDGNSDTDGGKPEYEEAKSIRYPRTTQEIRQRKVNHISSQGDENQSTKNKGKTEIKHYSEAKEVHSTQIWTRWIC